jgi:hypothetical protein
MSSLSPLPLVDAFAAPSAPAVRRIRRKPRKFAGELRYVRVDPELFQHGGLAHTRSGAGSAAVPAMKVDVGPDSSN